MVTPVGYEWLSSCAAIRVGIDNFQDTRFMFANEWQRGGAIHFADGPQGRERLLRMAALAVEEAMSAAGPSVPGDTALAVCLSERERPGRIAGLDATFLSDLLLRVGSAGRFQPNACLAVDGASGGVAAMAWAREALSHGATRFALVVGVDSFLHGPTLAAYHLRRRLVTTKNPNGFLPGEAAAAVLLCASGTQTSELHCAGIGWGQEPATPDSGLPLRADGLVQAYQAALSSAGCTYEKIDYRITDIGGEQADFKEATLALLRTMRVRKEFLDIWNPAECVGRVGSASAMLQIGLALAAVRRDFAPGPGALCHVSDDGGRRAAFVLQSAGRSW